MKSELWHSHPFWNASMRNERQSSYSGWVAAQFPLSSLFPSEVTGPIFMKFLNDVGALVLLITRAYTRRHCIPFQNARANSGDIVVPETKPFSSDLRPPSAKIDVTKLNHLESWQKEELLALLDKYSSYFSDAPDFCSLVEHEIPLLNNFVHKKLTGFLFIKS